MEQHIALSDIIGRNVQHSHIVRSKVVASIILPIHLPLLRYHPIVPSTAQQHTPSTIFIRTETISNKHHVQ